MNNDEVEKNIIETIELLGKVVTDNFKVINERITELFEMLKPRPIIAYGEGPAPDGRTATNTDGNVTVGPGLIITDDPNHGQSPTKQKNIPKIPANGKIPSRYKISSKVCKYCEGTIAWPRVFVTDKEVAEGKKRESSIHCDFDGNIEGDGRCPNF